MKKTKARLEILSALLSFPTISNTHWESTSHPNVGDLVSINCAPSTKFYVSWVLDIRKEDTSFPEYLLESIDDGSTCWWTNVGFNVYNKDMVKYNWRWDDDQFKLMSNWLNTMRRCDGYILSCTPPEFNGKSVTLKTRVRWDLIEKWDGNPKIFNDWKKLNIEEMNNHYQKSVNKYNRLLKAL